MPLGHRLVIFGQPNPTKNGVPVHRLSTNKEDRRGITGPHLRRGQRHVSEEDGRRGGRGGFRVFRGPSVALLELQ